MAIPTKTTVQETDNLPVEEEIEFSLGDPRWIMRTQAKLYADVTTAIIREYATNAKDAHDKAGNTAPIQVTLPSISNNNMFMVRDYGTGMDINKFRDIYTKFGESDKREDADANGMLGYGSKSGVAYGNTFTVTSVKDGIKITGQVLRRPDWSIVLKVLATKQTAEPNGTVITIPVHNPEEFVSKANDFFKWWLPGTVEVNGVEPDHAVGEEIVPGLYFSDQWATSYVVMANVPYRINNPAALFANTKMNHVNFVAYVDNGDVEFTPSREDLEYSDKTKRALHAIIVDFQTKIADKAQAEIDNAADHADAYMKWTKWCNTLGVGMFDGLTFMGDELENTFNIKGKRYATNQGRRGNTYSVHDWQVRTSDHTMFITDFVTDLTAVHKRKALAWADFKKMDKPGYVIFTAQSSVDSAWIDQSRVFSWDRIKKELPKEARGSRLDGAPRRIPGSFDYVSKDAYFYEETLPEGDIFYVHKGSSYSPSTIMSALKALDSDAVVVLLGANRINKFTRENKDVSQFWSWARTQVDTKGTDLLDKEGIEVLSLSDEDKGWAKALDLSKVDDPAFKRVVDLMSREDELTSDYKAAQQLAYTVKAPFEAVHVTKHSSVVTKYPLLKEMTTYWGRPNRVIDHTYLYLNTAYAAARKESNV